MDTRESNPIIGFRYEYGCDAPNRCTIIRRNGPMPEDGSIEALAKKHLSWNDVQSLAAKTGAKPVEATWSTWGGAEFDANGWQMILSLIRERESIILDKQKQEDAKIEQAFQRARDTGEPQVLDTYMAECDDPEEQCSLDHVTLLAMPNGKRKEERLHTW